MSTATCPPTAASKLNPSLNKSSLNKQLPAINEIWIKGFDQADELKHMGHKEGSEDYIKILNLPNGLRLAYSTMQPGFSINLCQKMHFGYLIQGQVRVTMSTDKSTESKLFKAGDVFFVAPDHNSLVEGDLPAKVIYLLNWYELKDFGNLTLFQRNVFKQADEVKNLSNMDLFTVKLNEMINLSYCTVKPGWKWSKDVKPLVNTDLCKHSHIMFQLEGLMRVVLSDGKEYLIKPGDVYCIPPNHDAYVDGNEAAKALDFGYLLNYAKPNTK